ncbi:MAG: 1-(5-phosphoribosyl)-5-[(5-phosphoribosylamino)methylideneamino]imidazole-4-carboxamide isomerase, partial [Thermodesulfobacteriota bacterium]|nr:1-(5-phosphoribosyl)-5-[(5-phosphoribosylamino)methylideneamino]imidazole-4-carboxamide isomerase [Thermodesulfobacteriota bacterium]
MLIIPAIDIKSGECVRLCQGKMNNVTVFSKNPKEMALKWERVGAKFLHLVDLDGAISGFPENFFCIKDIVENINIPCEIGGGIRDLETIEKYIASGANRVILGTVAFSNPDFIREACKKFPGQIVVGIDAEYGKVSIKGWTATVNKTPREMAKVFADMKVSAIIYTDIERDGMLTGPNVEATKRLALSTNIPVIASGGVSSLEDIKRLKSLKPYGVIGLIIGMYARGDVNFHLFEEKYYSSEYFNYKKIDKEGY